MTGAESDEALPPGAAVHSGAELVSFDQVDAQVWACATELDIVQETERVGSPWIGVQHVVLATLLDPIARRAFLSVNGDLLAVQRWVGLPRRLGPRSERRAGSPGTPLDFDRHALTHLARLLDRPRTDPELARWISGGGFRDPRARSRLRRRLLHDLLDERHELGVSTPLPGLDGAGWRQLARRLDESLRAEFGNGTG